MEFEVNNGRKIALEQAEPDGSLSVFTFSAIGSMGRKHEETYTITPGDFVMMLNWYRHQKRTGNTDLNF